ncbi:MAG: indole-3-glycerol phosphate synthase TrpC [Sulfolobaceae archaeon]|nr:indole-3-glycerol phosphate synthase TrpC [Sulfolobaceae archaeon]
MPKDGINGWLKDVIEHSLKRPKVKTERNRRINSFLDSIRQKKNSGVNAIIAEYKRRSPSGFSSDRELESYINYLRRYVAGFSILTEEKYFNGSYEILKRVSELVSDLPILMKDFVVSENQIDSAYNLGADGVLLIASILKERELEHLIDYARSYGLEPLVEVNNEDELKSVLQLDVKFMGINARNLFNLKVNLDTVKDLLELVPDNITKVAESGIKTREDILKLRKADAFLIGTSLMENPMRILELL